MNEEPSGDEVFVLIVSGFFALFGTVAYYRSLGRVATLGCPARQREPLGLAPLVGMFILLIILLFFAAKDVRRDVFYQILFLALAAAWLFGTIRLFPLLGLSLRQDALEQRNMAAVIAMTGAIIAVLLAYSFGNIGEGETIWTTVFSSLLATGGLLFLWSVLEIAAQISKAIAVERDPASGWRLAGFLVAVGLILGRAVAGDWQSAAGTVRDFFKLGWPALVLTVAAVIVERRLQPTSQRPSPPVATHGKRPAAFYLLFAVAVLLIMWRRT